MRLPMAIPARRTEPLWYATSTVFRILQTLIKPSGFAFGILYQCLQYSKSCRSLGFITFTCLLKLIFMLAQKKGAKHIIIMVFCIGVAKRMFIYSAHTCSLCQATIFNSYM